MELKSDFRNMTIMGGTTEFSDTNVAPRVQGRKTDLSDMTFSQLQDELRDLEKRMNTPEPVEKLPSEELRDKMRQLKSQRKLDLTLPVWQGAT